MSVLDTEKQQILHLIKTDKDYARYFFARVHSPEWFDILKQESFFDIHQTINEEKEKDFWITLDYLERLSIGVSKNPEQYKKYGLELLELINNTVRFSNETRKIKSHYIWWYFIKILNNLPLSIIEEQLRNKYDFRTWINTWTDPLGADMAISGVGDKLLGRFLDFEDGSMIKYAEIIIDVITKIRTNDKESLVFGIRESALLRWDAYWIVDAFHKNNAKIASKCSTDVVLGVADKLENALEYKQKDYSSGLIEIGTNLYRLYVSRIFLENLERGDIGFEKAKFNCVLKQFSLEQIEENNKKNNNNLWFLYGIDPATTIKEFIVNTSDRDLFVSFVKESLPTSINWDSDPELNKKIGFLFDGLFEDYSRIWAKSLSTYEEYHHGRDAEGILTGILRDLLFSQCENKPTESEGMLNKFLRNEYPFPIFKRFVLLCINKYWSSYGCLFNRIIEVIPTILHESDYEVEVYDIFLNHSSSFNTALTEKVKSLINSVPDFYKKEGPSAIAYWQFKWLSPLKNNQNFSDMYIKVKEIAKPKDDKDYQPDRAGFKGGLVSHVSPLSKEEILKEPVFSLIKYFSEFQGSDFWSASFDGKPDKEGLANTFQAAVKEDPKKFIDNIELFNQNGLYRYVHSMIWALREVWNAGTELNWEKILDFCLAYVQNPTFMEEAIKVQGEDSGKFRGKYIWFIDAVVGLIEDGSGDFKRHFAKEYFGKVEEIFDRVLTHVQGEMSFDKERDAITYAINTSLGKTIESYIVFSLLVAKVGGRPQQWGERKYERFLEKGIEAYIWLGRCLLNLRYLDESYVDGKVAVLAGRSIEDFQWQKFMEGYLFGGHLPKNIYHAMRLHYLKALKKLDFEEQIDRRLVEHICIGYLHYDESLKEKNDNGEESLFWIMLAEVANLNKRKRWLVTTEFLWGMTSRRLRRKDGSKEEKLEENIKKRILDFWAWTYAQRDWIKGILGNDSYEAFLGNIAKLTILLEKIDAETSKWLLLSAPFIDRQYYSSFLVEYLLKFEDEESIKWVGKIYLKVLENSTPTFKEEDIRALVTKVYKKGDWNDANLIAITYGRRGVNFLQDVWKENQKP